ncbi:MULTISPECIES: glycine cleavage system protein R [Shewanella]|jgi:glycine cleavage system regulatory protein|uniref:Transcriptional regulator n=1 Tax=Shewanella psychromarinicola TaxID=2487742 RepID=A0A3N4EGW6_9GAMM|nr:MULTISPECIES: ACT domain-containing protein [Shewanella]AZG34699.1 transcriptional regulator [Shewanella psychromarinicola]MCL1083028.1 transcriptional regulator [Shewanella psychromarinicola]PKG79677.1 transcriptional regulator [Shewanella sp. Actino-trap-3]RPA33510.1 transcriptional regulator [Shewanella psychromarinicola]
MQHKFITTVLGTLQPNLLQSLAQVSREIGASWETSKVIKLDGQFVAMMRVMIDVDKEASLKQALEQQFSQLTFVYAEFEHQSIHLSTECKLTLDCNDRSGLTHDINEILSDLDVSVDHQECYRVQVSSLGKTVYSAKMTLRLPENVTKALLVSQLETLSDNIRIDVTK